MKKLAITLDEEVARWERIKAAEQATSVSRLAGKMLREKMMHEQSYQPSMKRHLSKKPRPLNHRDVKYPAREDIHER